jgi:hypothetical protein
MFLTSQRSDGHNFDISKLTGSANISSSNGLTLNSDNVEIRRSFNEVHSISVQVTPMNNLYINL